MITLFCTILGLIVGATFLSGRAQVPCKCCGYVEGESMLPIESAVPVQQAPADFADEVDTVEL